jgi:hypothetical protein
MGEHCVDSYISSFISCVHCEISVAYYSEDYILTFYESLKIFSICSETFFATSEQIAD